MKKEIKIDGHYFTIKGEVAGIDKCATRYEHTDLFGAYDRPSTTKRCIWYEWRTFFTRYDSACWIHSHNTHMFTIKGYINYNGKMYQVYIYPTHNDLYELV